MGWPMVMGARQISGLPADYSHFVMIIRRGWSGRGAVRQAGRDWGERN
jgi:hypothetical protein